MSESSSSNSSRAPIREAHKASLPWQAAQAPNGQGRPQHDDDDPVTEWLLEQRHIDSREFAVLFAIHKLNARRPRSAWIRRTHLCRSAGLDQVTLTRVLTELRDKGLVGMSRHRVDSTRASYLLFIA